jgi:hypothetical protein
MAKETGFFLLEGGGVQEMDLPLHEAIAGRVAKGEIRRVVPVERDGEKVWEPYEEPTALPEVTADEAATATADLQAQHSAALDRIAELEATLASVTAERDELKTAAEKQPAKATRPKTE